MRVNDCGEQFNICNNLSNIVHATSVLNKFVCGECTGIPSFDIYCKQSEKEFL